MLPKGMLSLKFPQVVHLMMMLPLQFHSLKKNLFHYDYYSLPAKKRTMMTTTMMP